MLSNGYDTLLEFDFSERFIGHVSLELGDRIVDESHSLDWSHIVNRSDHLQAGRSVKARSIGKIVQGQRFQRLDRRLRQELLAIDGACLLSDSGEILAVGAILEIPSGSVGGGRLAAARALGKLGLGIKISQDGGIIGFRADRDEPAFRLM